MKRAGRVHVGIACRAELWLALSRLLAAGLPLGHALRSTSGVCAGRLASPLERTARAIDAGSTLSIAGARSGLLRRDEAALVGAAEHAGSLERVATGLAHRFRKRSELGRRMRAKLWLPGAVLVIAALVLPVPELYAGKLTVAEYALRALGPIGVAVALIALCMRLARFEMPATVASLVARLPGLAAIARRHARLQLLEHLALLLEAGVPVQTALPRALECVSNPALRAGLARAEGALAAGARVCAALRDAGALETQTHYPIASAGEASGRLEESLRRVAELERDGLRQTLELGADWLPRLVYLLVLALIAARIVVPALP